MENSCRDWRKRDHGSHVKFRVFVRCLIQIKATGKPVSRWQFTLSREVGPVFLRLFFFVTLVSFPSLPVPPVVPWDSNQFGVSLTLSAYIKTTKIDHISVIDSLHKNKPQQLHMNSDRWVKMDCLKQRRMNVSGGKQNDVRLANRKAVPH